MRFRYKSNVFAAFHMGEEREYFWFNKEGICIHTSFGSEDYIDCNFDVVKSAMLSKGYIFSKVDEYD